LPSRAFGAISSPMRTDAVDRAMRVIRRSTHYGASALDVGRAVAAGPAIDDTTRENLGLAIGARLVERGLVEITKSNRFVMPGARRR
jgi:hypothetical protein